jgi:hypothetical protein
MGGLSGRASLVGWWKWGGGIPAVDRCSVADFTMDRPEADFLTFVQIFFAFFEDVGRSL